MGNILDKFSLEGKVAWITGASYGLGLAYAKAYAEAGAKIVFNDIKQELVDRGLEEYKKLGIEVYGAVCDVTNEEQVQKFVSDVKEKVGSIDILVNNAGITKDGLIAMMKEENFSKVIDVNLKGTFNMCRNLVPYMMKNKSGNIVNISSVVGIVGNAGQSNYAASKAGVIGFSKALAKELAGRNIRVNAVAPGFIDTDMTSILSDKVKENIYSQIPLKRMGKAKEVANVVYFLSSEESSYITGQVINVDGGMVM